MTYKYLSKILINGIRNPKIISYNNELIIIGSKIYKEDNDKKKYVLYSYLLENNFKIKENSENILNFQNIEENFLTNFYVSNWIRDLYFHNNIYYLLVEFKYNYNNNFFKSIYYLLKTVDFINFEIEKKYNISDLLFKDYNNILFISKIENTDHIWGKYLFEFIINEKKIKPIFDNIVNIEEDYGHILHNLDYNNITKLYYIIFSIRHHISNNNFYYKIYDAYSYDLINYFNTNELKIDYNNKIIESEWFCYPWKFKLNNIDYILLNQDDFGKEKNPLIFTKIN